jgi:3-oxoacyl-[acyl-carrier protein] reductase
MTIKGKTVVISGGSSGIGAAIAKKLVSQGAKVYSLDKNDPVQPLRDVSYFGVNLTNEVEVRSAIKKVTESIDLLISCAGVMRRGTIFDSTPEDYDFLMNNNLKSAWLLIKTVKEKLADNAIVLQIASRHALTVVPDPGLYTLSKKAVATLAEILAKTSPDLTVKIAYPGPVLTPLLLTGRTPEDQERIAKIAAKPEELAEKIWELLCSDSKELDFNETTWQYEFK